MRRRPPRTIDLLPHEVAVLERLATGGHTAQRVARRAQILLAMADPRTIVGELADHFDQARTTIWQLCRRYDTVGVAAVFDAPRSGRPREFSPPGARCD